MTAKVDYDRRILSARIWLLPCKALCASLVFSLLFSSTSLAQSSATSISFQGVLNGANGQPLPNGSYTLRFQFWDHPTSTAASNRVGSAVTVPGVTVNGGVASTAIPVQPDWFDGQTRYLGTSVQGVNGGQELAPRVLVTAVPYAVTARNLDSSGAVFADLFKANRTGGRLDGTKARIVDTNTTYENFAFEGALPEPGVVHDFLGFLGKDAVFHRILGNGNDQAGFGVFEGPAIESPVIWMYAAGENMFAVKAKGHYGMVQDSQTLLAVRYHGGQAIPFGVGVGTEQPEAVLHVRGPQGSLPPHILLRITRPDGNIGFDVDSAGDTYCSRNLHMPGTARVQVLQITSAREAKQGFAPVDAAAILAKVAALPLSTWAYTNAPTIRHLGPVAQDFHAAFALGNDDKHIATVDADGVALAAIQGLHQLLQEKEARLAQLESAARAKDVRIASLESRLTALERLVEQRMPAGLPASGSVVAQVPATGGEALTKLDNGGGRVPMRLGKH